MIQQFKLLRSTAALQLSSQGKHSGMWLENSSLLCWGAYVEGSQRHAGTGAKHRGTQAQKAGAGASAEAGAIAGAKGGARAGAGVMLGARVSARAGAGAEEEAKQQQEQEQGQRPGQG